jgi:radical SAM protein with 4Fe4S-binding SPASM domain
VLELTHACGRACPICFHADGRGAADAAAFMPVELARTIIASAAAAGVARIRLTGGEPLLHPALLDLLRDLRARGLEAWVNTAGRPEGETDWPTLGAAADDVLLPVRDPGEGPDLAAAIAGIRRGGRARVRLGAVLTPAHLDRLPELVRWSRTQGCLLEVYRVMSLRGVNPGSTAADLERAVRALDVLNRGRRGQDRVRIANAVPFCLLPDRRLVVRNTCGARFDDGRGRLVVGPDGTVRPSYALRLPLGRADQEPLTALWQHPALVALHDPARLPLPCRACPELRECGGGSRHEAHASTGDLHGADPLARMPP